MAGTTVEGTWLATLAGISAGALGVLAKRALADARESQPPPALRTRFSLGPRRLRELASSRLPSHVVADRAGRRLNTSSALLALSVLTDSGVEHYRGMFHNKAMFIPLAASAATLATSLHGMHAKSGEAHPIRHAVAATAAVTGVVGGGFHLYNVMKREGGFSWVNLFYGAPLGAPYALILAGVMGTAAEHARGSRHRDKLRLFGLPAGRTLAALTSMGIVGTVAEAALLHLRGAFHDPFMYLPVTVPPVAAGLIAKAGIDAALDETPRWSRFTRLWLWITAALGFAGAGFHIFGVARNMGGWRNWSQNVLNGPPIPAPPSFTALALSGLAALGLMEERH